MTAASHTQSRQRLIALLSPLVLIFIGCRFLLLVLAPHQDPSEARYAEIARKMVETGNWVTPQHYYGVPFWAKPPLSMWMSGWGMEIFGVNEFGSRIVIFAAALALLALVTRLASSEWSPRTGIAVAVILMGSPLFFYCSAAVMTDLPLALGTTLAMVAFRFATKDQSRKWGYLFFVGLAIGLLAKGPLALVIALPPVIGWTLCTRRFLIAWNSIPWISGTLLMLAISVPWYLIAEKQTPGFIDYFILGEHWHRFVDSGWKGDLYGKAHPQPPGMIWIFALAGTFPWCLGFLALPFRQWRHLKSWSLKKEGLGLYLVLWAVWPIFFFTPARNVIATYPLPALPAIALLLGGIWHFQREIFPGRFHPLHPALARTCLALMMAAISVTLLFPGKSPKHSERDLIRLFDNQASPEKRLVYFGSRRHSAEFYSQGKVMAILQQEDLAQELGMPGTLYVAMPEKRYSTLPDSIQEKFVLLSTFGEQSALYREIDTAPATPHLEALHN